MSGRERLAAFSYGREHRLAFQEFDPARTERPEPEEEGNTIDDLARKVADAINDVRRKGTKRLDDAKSRSDTARRLIELGADPATIKEIEESDAHNKAIVEKAREESRKYLQEKQDALAERTQRAYEYLLMIGGANQWIPYYKIWGAKPGREYRVIPNLGIYSRPLGSGETEYIGRGAGWVGVPPSVRAGISHKPTAALFDDLVACDPSRAMPFQWTDGEKYTIQINPDASLTVKGAATADITFGRIKALQEKIEEGKRAKTRGEKSVGAVETPEKRASESWGDPPRPSIASLPRSPEATRPPEKSPPSAKTEPHTARIESRPPAKEQPSEAMTNIRRLQSIPADMRAGRNPLDPADAMSLTNDYEPFIDYYRNQGLLEHIEKQNTAETHEMLRALYTQALLGEQKLSPEQREQAHYRLGELLLSGEGGTINIAAALQHFGAAAKINGLKYRSSLEQALKIYRAHGRALHLPEYELQQRIAREQKKLDSLK